RVFATSQNNATHTHTHHHHHHHHHHQLQHITHIMFWLLWICTGAIRGAPRCGRAGVRTPAALDEGRFGSSAAAEAEAEAEVDDDDDEEDATPTPIPLTMACARSFWSCARSRRFI